MARYLPLIFRNSLRNRRRSILTICSVAASLCLLGVLMAMYQAFYFSEATPTQALRLITRNRISLTNPLPIYYGDKIRQVPGVQAVFASQWFGGSYKDENDPDNFFARFAADTTRLFDAVAELKTVPEEQKQAFLRDPIGAMIGRELSRKHNLKIGDRLTLVGDIFPINMEFTVRAIFDWPANEELMYFHLKYLHDSLLAGQRDSANTFGILVDSEQNVQSVARAVDEMFANSPVQTRTETEKAFELSFLAFLGNVKLFLLSICGAVTFTILLVSGNTMAMAVRERIREVGILKTLGYTRGAILGMMLGESTFIALIGGVFGCLLATGLCFVVRSGPAFNAEIKTLSLQPPVIALCLAIAASIGLISALLPAWSASRTSILESLRHTG